MSLEEGMACPGRSGMMTSGRSVMITPGRTGGGSLQDSWLNGLDWLGDKTQDVHFTFFLLPASHSSFLDFTFSAS